MQPDQPVHQAGTEQCRGKPAAAFDEQPRQAALAKPPQRRRKVELPTGIGRAVDDLRAVAAAFPGRPKVG